MKVAFDIDDTLIVPAVATGFDRDTPNYDTIALYKWFQAQGYEMILWSGSGMDWAKTWGEKLGLAPFTVRQKEKSEDVDIAFDDCEVDLGKVNVRVKRINNAVSRKDWNANKKAGGSLWYYRIAPSGNLEFSRSFSEVLGFVNPAGDCGVSDPDVICRQPVCYSCYGKVKKSSV